MVKKKKIIKRVTALGAVALLLLVAIAPVISPAADALPALPGNPGTDNETWADVAYLLIPLDRFSVDIQKISLENPFYSVALGDSTDGYSSSVDYKVYNYGAEPVWQFWKLGISDTGNGFYNAHFGLADLAITNAVSITFSNSSQFVVKIGDLNTFLNYSYFGVPQFYECSVTVNISGYYPYKAEDNSWHLQSFSESYTVSDKNVNSGTTHVILPQILPATISNQLGDESMLIVDEISITSDWFVSLEDLNLNGAVPPDFLRFWMPVSSDDFTCNIRDFWTQYPCGTYISDGVPGDSNFKLTVFLSNAVSGFFATEIIPGLSFGGMLSVAIGISLVSVFLKFFGG